MRFTSEIQDNSDFKFLMLDANIIIPYIDNKHQDHKDTLNEVKRLLGLNIQFLYSHPCLLEVLNYWRGKWIYTGCELLDRNSKNLPRDFYRIFGSARGRWNGGDHRRYLHDTEIKDLRDTLNARGGLWGRMISSMNGKISKLPNDLGKIKIYYADFDSIYYPIADKANWPKMDNVYLMIEKYGLGSNDAAILNMANYSSICGFVSNDGDMSFAINQGAYNPAKFFGIQ